MSHQDNGHSHRARKVIPGGITRSTVYVPPHPPYAERGEGAIVTDQRGYQVIDCNNNYTSLIHGHANQNILDAAFSAAQSGTAFGLPTVYEIELAETLTCRTGIPKWRFCNSGTEAVMMLVRGLRAATGRDMIVRFDGSYHGTADTVTAPGSSGVPEGTSDTVLALPQGDLRAVRTAFERYGDRIAGVLIDLMPNRAGLLPADPEYVRELRQLTRENGALLAVDEVITFRLTIGGLHGEYDLDPDLISLGKIIGGGFPVGAVGGRDDLMAAFDPRTVDAVSWGGTFSANPVTMAAGAAALRQYGNDEIARLNGAGDSLRTRILDAGIAVNGSGSLLRLFATDVAALWWALYERGVLVGTNGLIALSTAMADEHLVRIEDAILDVASGRPELLSQAPREPAENRP